MKAISKIVRHYWKYNYTSWTQPVLTGFTTSVVGGNVVCTNSGYYVGEGEHEYGWYIMDGNKSGSSINRFWSPDSLPAWVKIAYPYKLKITAIKLYNRWQRAGAGATSGQIYTDENMTTPIGDAFTIPAGNWATLDITGIAASGVVTNSFYIYITSGGIGEVELTAELQELGTGTSTDYDFYTDDNSYFLPNTNGTYYGINQ